MSKLVKNIFTMILLLYETISVSEILRFNRIVKNFIESNTDNGKYKAINLIL